MPFTDKELKQLKRMNDSPDDGAFANWLNRDRADALIARLEAAELLAECLSNHEDLDPVEVTEIGNWRRAAGRV